MPESTLDNLGGGGGVGLILGVDSSALKVSGETIVASPVDLGKAAALVVDAADGDETPSDTGTRLVPSRSMSSGFLTEPTSPVIARTSV